MQLAFASNHETNASTMGKMMSGNGNLSLGRGRLPVVTTHCYGQSSPDMIERERFQRSRHVTRLHGVQAEKACLLYEAYAYLHFKRFNTKPIACIMQMVSAIGMYRVPRQTVNEDGAEILLPIGLFGMPFEQAFCEFCNDMEALYAEGGKQRLAWAQKGMSGLTHGPIRWHLKHSKRGRQQRRPEFSKSWSLRYLTLLMGEITRSRIPMDD